MKLDYRKLLGALGLGGAAVTSGSEEAEAGRFSSLWHSSPFKWNSEVDVHLPEGLKTLIGTPDDLPDLGDVPYNADIEAFPFGRPRADKIGTGEGNTTEGIGLYASDNSEMNERYAEYLADIKSGTFHIKNKEGKELGYKETKDLFDHLIGQYIHNGKTPEEIIAEQNYAFKKDFDFNNANLEDLPPGTMLEEPTIPYSDEEFKQAEEFVKQGYTINKDPISKMIYSLKTDLDTDQFIDLGKTLSIVEDKKAIEVIRSLAHPDVNKKIGPKSLRPLKSLYTAAIESNVPGRPNLQRDIDNELKGLGYKGFAQSGAGRPGTGHFETKNPTTNYVFFNPEELKVIDRANLTGESDLWRDIVKQGELLKRGKKPLAAGGLLAALAAGGAGSAFAGGPLPKKEQPVFKNLDPSMEDSRENLAQDIYDLGLWGDEEDGREKASKLVNALDWTGISGGGLAISEAGKGQYGNAALDALFSVPIVGPAGRITTKVGKNLYKKLKGLKQ